MKNERSPITALLAIILCLVCAGCVHYSSPAERDASFASYKEVKIGAEPLRKHLLTRSAILLHGDTLATSPISTNTIQIGNLNAWYGTATAIDRRGYFLTAAHCVDNKGNGRFWLAFWRAGTIQVEGARIVWCGDTKKREPDLAILCISQPIDQSFEWATEFTNGMSILDVGASYDVPTHDLKTQCMAGKILKVSDQCKNAGIPYTVVSHDSPLRHGDSGGPLVLSDGRLLGINVIGEIGIQWKHLLIEPLYYEAHCPNLEWLRSVINNDAALQPSAAREIPLAGSVSPAMLPN